MRRSLENCIFLTLKTPHYLHESYPPFSVTHSVCPTPSDDRSPTSAVQETKHSSSASTYVASSTSSTSASQSSSPTSSPTSSPSAVTSSPSPSSSSGWFSLWFLIDRFVMCWDSNCYPTMYDSNLFLLAPLNAN